MAAAPALTGQAAAALGTACRDDLGSESSDPSWPWLGGGGGAPSAAGPAASGGPLSAASAGPDEEGAGLEAGSSAAEGALPGACGALEHAGPPPTRVSQPRNAIDDEERQALIDAARTAREGLPRAAAALQQLLGSAAGGGGVQGARLQRARLLLGECLQGLAGLRG